MPNAHRLLLQTEHRPWPLPQRKFLMHQSWHDLLFAHWPIPAELLRPMIPAALQVDTFDGMGWLGIVPFHMTGIHLRGLPPIPFTSAFPELNVRTYVTYQGKPGVYFFSLDARHRVAVEMARLLFHLPYLYAHIAVNPEPEEGIAYECVRHDRRGLPAVLSVNYRPISDVYASEAGSLDHWLTERYCLYSCDANGSIYRGEIHHKRWPLQKAEANIKTNTMASSHGIELPACAPVLHYAKRLDVLVWGLERVSRRR